ncbi:MULTISPECIES: response regulator [Thermodesulfovibrio]|uniref:response regulator n=1 Tax=Thermodesulfovibrio TaxID=28261 RepID=UPI00261405D7|nr:response regulator [Thermodesulfovibrio sp.]
MTKGKILVIDDSPLVRKLAEVSLQEKGYEVYTSADGEEGLRLAEDIKPDLILVDFIMPKMTGSQFCKSLRENNDLKDTPVILITGKGETVGQTFIEKYGVIDYFIKPFKSEDLIDKVESTLNKITETPYKEAVIESSAIESLQKETIEEEVESKAFDELLASFEPPKTEELIFTEEKEDTAILKDEESIKEEISISLTEDILSSFEKKETDKIEFKEPPQLEITEGLPEINEIVGVDQKTEEVEVPTFYTEHISLENIITTQETISETIEGEISIPQEQLEEKKEEPIEVHQDIKPSEDFSSLPTPDFNELFLKFAAYLDSSLEALLKKYGVIKEPSTILSGNLRFFSIYEIFSLISSKNLSGLFLVFDKGNTFELLFLEGKLVYGVSSLQKYKMGGKVFSEISQGDIKSMLSESIQELRNNKSGSFIFELNSFDTLTFTNRERYDFREFFS